MHLPQDQHTYHRCGIVTGLGRDRFQHSQRYVCRCVLRRGLRNRQVIWLELVGSASRASRSNCGVKKLKRSRRKHWMLTVIALLVVSVILVLVIPIQNNTSLRSSSLPDPPRYTLRGPHPVGTRDLLIPGEPKPEVTAWYPALHNDSKEDAIS